MAAVQSTMPPPKPAIRLHHQWAPLDEGAQPVFEQFHTGYLIVPLGSCTWERGTRFIWFKFYQFIPPCPWTNSLLCLHRLMMLLFTQVRFYSTSQQATLSWVIQRGQGKALLSLFLIRIPFHRVIRSRCIMCWFTDLDAHTWFFIPIGHFTTDILLSSRPL